MMKNTSTPIISICIPTYNRYAFLEKCIACIVSQEGFDTDIIEIVVSDNASTDVTSDIVSAFQMRYSNIAYFRNKENIGANLNLFRVAECAQGKYIWFMGDDDLIDEGGLMHVLYFLSQCNDIVLIQTNMLDHSDAGTIIQNGVDYWKRLVDTKQANKLSVFLLFLSMVIVRREDFISQLELFRGQFPHKLKEAFAHFYVLIRCISSQSILLLGKTVSGGAGNIEDKEYFKNSSKNWYNLVITNGIDKINEDSYYLSTIGIDGDYLYRFRKNFIKIYRYMRVSDYLKIVGIYHYALSIFRKFFLSRM